jgi:hypothetical protein
MFVKTLLRRPIMSWSLSASGPAKDVAPQIEKQISAISLSDAGEMETVKNVGALLTQTLGTYDPDKPVKVSANGHMGFADWATKAGPHQHVALTIEPIHFTTS